MKKLGITAILVVSFLLVWSGSLGVVGEVAGSVTGDTMFVG